MRLYFSALLCFVFSFASAAEQEGSVVQKNVDDIIKLELSKEFCQKLIIEHRPRHDVMYQGGIDAEGEAVVPADLNAFVVPVPKRITIPITIQKQYSLTTQSSGTITTPEGAVSGQVSQSGTADFLPKGIIKSPYVDEIPLGFVEYELESGKMTYNGKTFSSQQEALLRQKCQDVLEKSEN